MTEDHLLIALLIGLVGTLIRTLPAILKAFAVVVMAWRRDDRVELVEETSRLLKKPELRVAVAETRLRRGLTAPGEKKA